MHRFISVPLRDARLLAIADQAGVSATSFLVLVVLARLAAPEEVGLYAILISVIVVAMAVQDALIAKPFTINIMQSGARAAEQAFATMCLGGLFGAAVCITGLAIAIILSLLGFSPSTVTAIVVLSLSCPAFLQRELVRRYQLARLRAGHALLLDACISAGTLSGLAVFYASGTARATEVLWLMASCNAVVSFLWLYTERREFTVDLAAVRSTLRLYWESGRYFLSGQLAMQVQGYLGSWVAVAVIGKAAAGIYAACATLAGVCHPIIFGYANIMTPRFVRVFAESGNAELRRRAVVETAILASIISVFCAAIIFYAEELVGLLYRSEAYASQADVSRILTIAAFAGSLGVAPSLALAAAGQARMAAGVMIASAIVNLAFVIALLPTFGIEGAAFGVLASEIVTATARWIMFLKCVPANQPRAAAAAELVVAPAGTPARICANVEKDRAMQDPTAALLARIFQLFDREGVACCVLHGYERLSQEITSDVDCLISRKIRPHALLQLLCKNRDEIGAHVVQQRDYYFVLAIPDHEGSFRFLQLDFYTDCTVGGVRVLSGDEILAARRRHEDFWVPAPEMEFVGYLVRILDQDKLTDERIGRLTRAFNQNPAAAQDRLHTIFSDKDALQILAAVMSGNWSSVRERAPEIRKRLLSGHPFARAAFAASALPKRMKRLARPSGVSVVFLGPDGAGKSSVVTELPARLAPVLDRHASWGFAPSLRSLVSRSASPLRTDRPHLLEPRSAPLAALRICYWFTFNLISHLVLRVAVAGSCLVMYDRHFVDILVDQRRYRYAGPKWVLRLLCALAPQPDLVIVLDAPATVLQSRKREVPLEVTAQQCAAYRKLAQGMRQAKIVDAAQPLPDVVNAVTSLVVDCLRRRIQRRAGVEPAPAGQGDRIRISAWRSQHPATYAAKSVEILKN